MGNLTNKTAIITGGAQGIGKAIARRLLLDGARVAILDVNEQNGKATAAELGRENDGRALFVHCDVTSRESVKHAVDAVLDAMGGIDVLVNNAGIGRSAPFLDLSDDAWAAVLAVNLTGTFMMAQEVCRCMVKARKGTVINMGSAAAHMAHSGQSVYGASKAGLEQLTRAMAFELGPMGIRVNAISPGTIETEFLKAMLTEAAKTERERRIPAGRLGTPEEVADVVAFLASDESRYVNGAVLPIDGGLIFAGIRACTD